jgi:hypothetical protein
LNPAEIIKQVFMMAWLWSIFAGFYLVAYVFWIPGLFNSLPLVIALAAMTLILGVGFLYDGFLKATELQSGIKRKPLSFGRVRRLVGGFLLLGYLLVYLPPQGRIVAHWPLDMAITAASGLVMLVYGISNIRASS